MRFLAWASRLTGGRGVQYWDPLGALAQEAFAWTTLPPNRLFILNYEDQRKRLLNRSVILLFSQESLQKIRQALAAATQINPNFSVSLSADHLKSAYGWGEGIEILFEKGRYVCIRHLEKATNMETLVDEAQAVALFIQMACHSKSSVF